LRIFAHHTAEIGRLHLLRPFVLDAEFLLGPLQGDMDLVDPWLLGRRGEDRRHLQLLVLRQDLARQHRCRQAERAEFQQIASRKPFAFRVDFALPVFHCMPL
jgi:hypothetical protein